MSRRVDIRDERGWTLVELMVSLMIGMVVFAAAMTVSQVALKNQAKTAARVDADQRARPVLQRLMDQLHSTCVAPNVSPVQPGSSDTSLSFIHQTGSAVTPTPVKRITTLSGTTLSQSTYAAIGGESPNWTFSTTPSSTVQLLTKVSQASLGSPAVTVPVFRYYPYNAGTGQISTTPLATPLTDVTAPTVVQVSVAFAAAPGTTPVADPKAGVSVSDTAYLRFSPPSEDSSEVNVPCA